MLPALQGVSTPGPLRLRSRHQMFAHHVPASQPLSRIAARQLRQVSAAVRCRIVGDLGHADTLKQRVPLATPSNPKSVDNRSLRERKASVFSANAAGMQSLCDTPPAPLTSHRSPPPKESLRPWRSKAQEMLDDASLRAGSRGNVLSGASNAACPQRCEGLGGSLTTQLGAGEEPSMTELLSVMVERLLPYDGSTARTRSGRPRMACRRWCDT